MAIVDFNSHTWDDPWMKKLSIEAKMLFIYLWTNNHKNLVGMYQIEKETMAFETGLKLKEIDVLLKQLRPKVLYDNEKFIIWIANHVRHQFMRTEKLSPKILVGIKKCLLAMKGHDFIKQFIDYYPELSIPYEYSIGRVLSYPTSEGESEGKGEGEGKDLPKTIKHIYGEFKNVLLTDEEFQKLKDKFNSDAEKWIKTVDEGKEYKGYKYKSDYLAILKWADNKVQGKKYL